LLCGRSQDGHRGERREKHNRQEATGSHGSPGDYTAVVFGISEGGPLALTFAATRPDRVRSLVVYGTYPKLVASDDYPGGVDPGFVLIGSSGCNR